MRIAQAGTSLELDPPRGRASSIRAESGPHDALHEIAEALHSLRAWMQAREYAGFEPYDLLNSPYLRWRWARWPVFSVPVIQLGKRAGGLMLRRLLRVPPGKNPKALALVIAGLCDLARCGEDSEAEARRLKSDMLRLRSPGEQLLCWGYDWHFVSLRGTTLPAWSPNSIASTFCGSSLLDMAEVFADDEAGQMAESVGRFIATRLNRSVDSDSQLCFSYTPDDRTFIFNSSALAGAFLARLAAGSSFSEYLEMARRVMRYLAGRQESDGSWKYGAGRAQSWKDSFHTAYNLTALLDYRRLTGDESFDATLRDGYRFYKDSFFRSDGAPKYFCSSLYPIDIHSCAQAILTFCAFADLDPEGREWALRVTRWTLRNMRGADGSFYYQRHRFRVDRTPYMRWGQAWMFRALARVKQLLSSAT
jgi:hypothetical protein